ncbi:uncharacterized protein LOC132722417 [Ruditapes philippinarum]|uniref:uncharacterized protein LOC132722417 n=1 Tax=Ruditapes philippinarum TaxID=129788 RepID=UPI00295B33E7|nr:uncharacterized protein LOC132722417 [Ruditapes philippinarum]
MHFRGLLLQFISLVSIVCLTRAKKLCDVRVWYLNMINDDVFDVDLTDQQHNLKIVIESLVMRASESRETRMLECSTLYLYNDMLKDLFDYTPSGSGMELKEVESEETDVKDTASSSDDINKQTNNNKEESRESENEDGIEVNSEIDGLETQIDKIEGNVDIDKTRDDILDSQADIDERATTVGEDKDILTDETDQLSNEAVHIDETEYLEDTDPDLSSLDEESEESVQANQNNRHATPTDTESDTEKPINKVDVQVTKSIPFGVCYSFGCLMSDIFDVYSSGDLSKINDINDDEVKIKTGSDNSNMSIVKRKFKLKCPFGSFCTLQCFYKFLLSKSFCMKSFISSEEPVDLTKDNKDNTQDIKEYLETISQHGSMVDINSEINDNADTMKIHKSVLEDQDINPADKSFSTEEKFLNKLSLADFEQIVEQKTRKYYSKIQHLEMMIMKLENQLLLAALNKQNHSSTISKLENQILKFENELLRMNKNYQYLREETENTSKRQHKYLELAFKQTRKEYPKLPDKSNDKYEIITQHQAKINELADVLRNQSSIIMQLKVKHDHLEEQNKLLHEMVMNQTIFMNSIVKTVQDLSEQNIKNKNEITALRLKVAQSVTNANDMKVNVKTNDNQGVIDELDTLLFNNLLEKSGSITKDKVDSKSKVSEETNERLQLQSRNDKNSEKSMVTNWCPRDDRACPSCHYSPYVHLNCFPYQNVLWSELWKKKSNVQNTIGDYPTVPDVIDDTENPDSDRKVVAVLPKARKKEYQSKPNEIEEKNETNLNNIQNKNEDNSDQNEENNIKNEDIFVQNIGQQEKFKDAMDTIKENLNKEKEAAEDNDLSKYTLVGYDRNGKPVFIIRENPKDKEAITESLPTDTKTRIETSKNGIQTSERLTINKDEIKNELKTGEDYDLKTDSNKNEKDKTKSEQEDIEFKEIKDIAKDTDNQQGKDIGKLQTNDNAGKANDVSKSNSPTSDSKVPKLGEDNESEKESTSNRESNLESKDNVPKAENKKVKIALKENKDDVGNDKEPIKTHEEKQASTGDKVVQIKQKENDQQMIKQSISKPRERKIPINIEKPKQSEPKDCYDIYLKGEKRDGLYKVKPLGSDTQIQVFCDMRKGGWTVIQRRQDGTTNFFQEWDDYKKGFGGLYGEHWLGNDNIHYLTNQDFYKLRVDMMDWEKTKKFAEFDYFLVDSEDEGYKLHIDGYNGDAGDGLTKHDGSKFSTKDVDNDKVVKEFGGSCAKRFTGAGWYYKCYASNLNGKFYKGGKIPEKRFDGVTWKPWTGPNYSLKKVEMKLRPASAKN